MRRGSRKGALHNVVGLQFRSEADTLIEREGHVWMAQELQHTLGMLTLHDSYSSARAAWIVEPGVETRALGDG